MRWELVADDGTTTPVAVPGTVTQAHPDAHDADLRTWVFRGTVEQVPPGPVDLVLDGVATAYDVVVDGTLVATGRSAYTRHRLPVDVRPGSVVEVVCHPLATALPEAPPRARWRSRVVDDQSLRLVRTPLLGRCPGFAPGPPVVGPYRDVRLETARPRVQLRTRVEGRDGVLTVTASGGTVTCAGAKATLSSHLAVLRIPEVDLWWPATHGEPVLHDVHVDGVLVGRVGFRTVEAVGPVEDGFGLRVNGVELWLRGAVWTPPGLLTGVPEDPRPTVAAAASIGMNLLRAPGLAAYEDDAFFTACDELGVLVWHDLALANLDVPHDLLDLDGELDALLDKQSHPSLAVVCGGSEVAQQVQLLGLDPDLWRTPFLARAATRVAPLVWVPSSPYATGPVVRPSAGVAHWFGVGGYRKPLSEQRRTPVRFAAECLAFSHGEGEWVPRDSGADWDFADAALAYAPLSVGEVMERVLGDWRRPASGNRGALVLWLRDLQPGAGWGLLQHDGTPKPAWERVARVMAPRAVWLTDEGLDGVHLHLANDRAEPWEGDLEVRLLRADGVVLGTVTAAVSVPAHAAVTHDVEVLLGRWQDVGWAFRFGAREVDEVVALLTGVEGRLRPDQG